MTNPTHPRKGARTMAEIPPRTLAAINRGQEQTVTLVEILAADFALLMKTISPSLARRHLTLLKRTEEGPGIVGRMRGAGELLFGELGETGAEQLRTHQSDIVRGWAAYMIGSISNLEIAEYLARVRPLADDPHSGVREWAWMALRGHIAARLEDSLELLEPWTRDASANIRRFAIESTRPRGVWCAHISRLRESPELAANLLENVKADPTKYVQDSCANWLNDASKSKPAWVRGVCARWRREGKKNRATERICARALRTLSRKT